MGHKPRKIGRLRAYSLAYLSRKQGHSLRDSLIFGYISGVSVTVPPAGIEPAPPPPEGGALSPELRGLKDRQAKAISDRIRPTLPNNRRTVRIPIMSERAYFATGCFWGAERRFWQMPGVESTSVGYMGGARPNPSYEQVCTGVTGHAEAVEVVFDPTVVSYQRLLEEFWTMHDPTSLNKQGGDIGTQYRSAIFATTPEQLLTAINSKDVYEEVLLQNGLDPICTEIQEAQGHTYWPAEEYHQKYLAKNPHGYDCHSSTGIAFPIIESSAGAN